MENDVSVVEKALKNRGFLVKRVMNPDHRQLREEFTAFINKYGMREEDRLLFYYAGHGHTHHMAYGGEMGYIVPRDADNPNKNKDSFMNKALDMTQIEVYARRIQAKHVLFLFDCCFAGSIFDITRAGFAPANISYKTRCRSGSLSPPAARMKKFPTRVYSVGNLRKPLKEKRIGMLTAMSPAVNWENSCRKR